MHPALGTVDWEQENADAVALLQQLLRHDTTNPPGEEAGCAAFLADWLRAGGIEPRMLESAPGRANVLARLAGDEDPPLLLSAHLDVVPAEEQRWRHPPFGGEIHDGFVWGRGAIDMKHMAAMSAVVLRLLARIGAPLRRDVAFAAVADEEAGCTLGSAWLVDNHPDEVRAGYVLGEVGGFTLDVGGRAIYPVQVAEKGMCWIRATARGTSGHGSVPREDNAIVALSRFLDRVGSRRMRLRLSEPVERFVRELAATQSQPARKALPLVLNPRLSGVVLDRLTRDASVRRSFHAMLRNTVSPTVVQAGSKTNVIPGEATAELDGRIAVGSSADELLAELRELGGDGIELEVLQTHPPTSSPADTELFDVIADVVASHHLGAVAVPNVIPGFTDAAYWSKLGAVCYGFSPVRLDPADDVAFADLFHGDDERIPVAGFTAGLRMLADVVFRFCVR
jgi:acetylornithine deacetylase/succinyl-diaminopimelate desuccinylase-like protein